MDIRETLAAIQATPSPALSGPVGYYPTPSYKADDPSQPEPGLESPMFSPDSLIGSGLPTMAAKLAATKVLAPAIARSMEGNGLLSLMNPQMNIVAPVGRVLAPYKGSELNRLVDHPDLNQTQDKLLALAKYAQDNYGSAITPEHMYNSTGVMYEPTTRKLMMYDGEMGDVLGKADFRKLPDNSKGLIGEDNITASSIPVEDILGHSHVLDKYPEISGYKVRYMTPLESLNAAGTINPATKTISIRPGMSRDYLISVLDHELGHAIEPSATGADITNQKFINAVRGELGRSDPRLAHGVYMRDPGETLQRASQGMTYKYLNGNTFPAQPGMFKSMALEGPLRQLGDSRSPLENALYAGAIGSNLKSPTALKANSIVHPGARGLGDK